MIPGCEALAGAALVSCLARDPRCLPPQHAHHLPAILSTTRQESRHHPYAVRNEAEGRGHIFTTKAAAVAYAVAADAAGAVLGLGLGQITFRVNWRLHTGMEGRAAIEALLDPCTNLRATAAHWAMTWAAAVAYNAGPRRMDNPPPASANYATRVALGAQQAPLPAATPSLPDCPGSPPRWDAWASARHAARCTQQRVASIPHEGPPRP